jgi:hypothetical protein
MTAASISSRPHPHRVATRSLFEPFLWAFSALVRFVLTYDDDPRDWHAMRCRVGDALTSAGQWVVTILGAIAALVVIVGSVLLLVFAGLNLLGVVTK